MNVLLTKRLAQDQIDLIRSWGWNCEVAETLKVALIDVIEAPVEAGAWVVSSRNSFAVLKKFITHAPQRIYCVGDWMKNEIEKLGANVSVKSYGNMKSLVSDLSKMELKKVVYLCGNDHRQELEEGLKNTVTAITKVITHESEMIFPIIKRSFDAVFVFSPRSAESLLKHNHFLPQTIFACIGSTTADYLHNHGITKTFTPSVSDSNVLLNEFHSQILNLKH